MLALLSVYNKEGISCFARQLVELGWEIISSGGTAKVLAEAGIPVSDVAELVGGNAILGHRVVTLSREIHAGLLATDNEEDYQELKRLGIPRIDLVCVDLYPLQEEIKNPNSTRKSVIEKTDIGGPTMLRSAAKGRRIVICDPCDRQPVIDWLKTGRPDEDDFITKLIAKTEAVVAEYCLASARYHSNGVYDGIIGKRVLECLYGENAWQTPAGLFSIGSDDPLALEKFQVIAGTSPSYNNLCDIDRLLQTITHIAAAFDLNQERIPLIPAIEGVVPLIAIGCKHGNLCGAAVGSNALSIIQNMIRGDTRAIFGGLVMVNFQVGEKIAEELLTYLMPEGKRRLLDGIIAPSFTERAIDMLKRKGDKCRFLINPALEHLTIDSVFRFRYVRGGFLRQPNYTFVLDLKNPDLEIVGLKVSKLQESDLLLAWAVGSTSNSNTITLVKNGKMIGNGVGQQDRVGAATLAIIRAKRSKHDIKGAVAYSDSFFPFPDGPQVLIEAGVQAILTSKGSVNDETIREVCRKAQVSLYFLPDQKCRGFFGH